LGGLVVAWDVLAWVPEATVVAGVQFDRKQAELRLGAEVGARRYVAREWAIGMVAGAEWGPTAGAMMTVAVAVWLEP
jgi:hypothetical protein